MKLAAVLLLLAVASPAARAINVTTAKIFAAGEVATLKRTAAAALTAPKPEPAFGAQGKKNVTDGPAYLYPGPCTPAAAITGSVQAPLADGKNATLNLFLTLPSACAAGRGRAAPWPLVMWYNGWSLASSEYAAYAARLASWGYAVLQYDVPTTFNVTPDSIEFTFLPLAVAWAGSAAAVATSPILVAGHSRGGRLAADLFCAPPAGTPAIAAAAWIDPTDNDYTSPESALYPSGIKACAAASKPVSLTLSGLKSPNCKPPGAAGAAWTAVAGAGSWVSTLLKGTHTAFINSTLTDVAVAAAFCLDPPSLVARDVAYSVAAGQAAAWFDARLQPPDSQLAANQAAFLAWAAAQGAWMSWEVKP